MATTASSRQNRVDPWSRVVATPARGSLMGNRGCLHNAHGQVVRQHQGMRWISCLLHFKGRRRALMQPGKYTELFFLDEATALAAGHRPCAECQRARYEQFRAAWAVAHELAHLPSAGEMDSVLHGARLAQGRKVTYTARLGDLPRGTMVALDGQPHLLWYDSLWRWDFDGYTPGPTLAHATVATVLTPQPTMATIRAGYAVAPNAALPCP